MNALADARARVDHRPRLNAGRIDCRGRSENRQHFSHGGIHIFADDQGFVPGVGFRQTFADQHHARLGCGQLRHIMVVADKGQLFRARLFYRVHAGNGTIRVPGQRSFYHIGDFPCSHLLHNVSSF